MQLQMGKAPPELGLDSDAEQPVGASREFGLTLWANRNHQNLDIRQWALHSAP